MIDPAQNTDGFGDMERWYGTNPVYNGVGNTKIVQAFGQTNYPSMIADLNDGTGTVAVKYIFLRSTVAFTLNEIFCYELQRVLHDDIISIEGNDTGATYPIHAYHQAMNSPLLMSQCFTIDVSDDMMYTFSEVIIL